MKKVLYLTYDGLLEPLGYTQIISYLLILSENNNITIISVEKEKDLNNKKYYNKIIKLLENKKITWKYLIYKKGFSRYLLITKFIFLCIKLHKVNKFQIFHSRSYITGLISFFLSFFFKFFFIFDIRGFWIDERIDWKIWKKRSLKYFFFKFFEKKIFNRSQAVVSLTKDAEKIIKTNYLNNNSITKVYVIPTCTKLNNIIKKNSNFKLTFTHLGSIGTRYNFDLYLKIMIEINKRKKISLSIINKNEHKKINKYIKNYNNFNIDYNLKYIEPDKILSEILNSNFGVFFPVKGFYLNAYFPTKLGEFLSSGIPVITSNINDHVNNIIIKNNVGIVISQLDNIDYDNLYNNIVDFENDLDLNDRCRKVAEKYFNIKNGANIYSQIYKSL